MRVMTLAIERLPAALAMALRLQDPAAVIKSIRASDTQLARTWRMPPRYSAEVAAAVDALIRACNAAGVGHVIAGRLAPKSVFSAKTPIVSSFGRFIGDAIYGRRPYLLINYQSLHLAKRTGALEVELNNKFPRAFKVPERAGVVERRAKDRIRLDVR